MLSEIVAKLALKKVELTLLFYLGHGIFYKKMCMPGYSILGPFATAPPGSWSRSSQIKLAGWRAFLSSSTHLGTWSSVCGAQPPLTFCACFSV
eukprot:6175801-Pleurochrysis_carterae.AAC.1